MSLEALDTITARHDQALAIIAAVMVGHSRLSDDVVERALWAAQTLIEQAGEIAEAIGDQPEGAEPGGSHRRRGAVPGAQ